MVKHDLRALRIILKISGNFNEILHFKIHQDQYTNGET